MSKKTIRFHQERDSPFFRLKSRKKLADLLFVGLEKLESLARSEDLYHEFDKSKPSGGVRRISAPREDLKAVQRRISDLLGRTVPPDYLFAPVAGRSYVDNAAAHIGAASFRLLDIEDFFPSCTANRVIWFFGKRMQCSPDVSAVMRGLVTQNGSLPQGSPCSPILAYLSYVDMWEEISSIVETAGCQLSVYADDITVSGSAVPEAVIWELKKLLHKYGHNYQRSKERSRHRRPVEITGVIVRPDGLHAPNRSHKKLRDDRRELKDMRSGEHKEKVKARVCGRQAQIGQITRHDLTKNTATGR